MVMNLWRCEVVGFALNLMFLNAQLAKDTTVTVNVNCQLSQNLESLGKWTYACLRGIFLAMLIDVQSLVLTAAGP